MKTTVFNGKDGTYGVDWICDRSRCVCVEPRDIGCLCDFDGRCEPGETPFSGGEGGGGGGGPRELLMTLDEGKLAGTPGSGGKGCPDCKPSSCGDRICDPRAREDCSSCPIDCGPCPPACGDGNCDKGEDPSTCPADCGGGSACPFLGPTGRPLTCRGPDSAEVYCGFAPDSCTVCPSFLPPMMCDLASNCCVPRP